MEEILTSMESAFATGQSNATSAIAVGVAAGIPIMLILFGVRAGMRAFKSASK